MARVSRKVSESLSEYLILPGKVICPPEKVSLHAQLGDISLQYPFMTARMQSVVGSEMAVAAGRNGILTMVPRSLREKDKDAILSANNKARLRKGDIEFQENPEAAHPETTLEEVMHQIERTGHSVIPIMDRKSKLYGVYIHDLDNPPSVSLYDKKIKEVMTPLRDNGNKGIPYVLSDKDAGGIKEIMKKEGMKFLPIVDKGKILQKIAFLQRFDTNYIGTAISTRGRWKEEIEKYGPLSDTLLIDSSNAYFKDSFTILKYAKKRFPRKPFGIGNIVQGKHFTAFAEAGADYIIGGMGVGSICQTGSTRGNGRGQFTVAKELADARDRFRKKRRVALVIDGGIKNLKDMTVALAFGDFIMMGNYFNGFYEAAGKKLDAEGRPTSKEDLIMHVETWGEGHPMARLVAMYGMNFEDLSKENLQKRPEIQGRYGHITASGATKEGVLGNTEYKGRLKPGAEHDAKYIRTTISNSTASDLASFRKNAVLERCSAATLEDMLPHSIRVKG